jgi:hypothetical protein
MKRARPNAAPASAGFTILEVLVSLAILLFGMTAVLGLLTFGAALSRSAELRTAAAAATEAVIADLEVTIFPTEADGELGEPVPIRERSLPNAPEIVYSAEAKPNPARPLEYRVDVELAWKSSGVRRERRFTTLLIRERSFGERLRRRISGEVQATPPARKVDAKQEQQAKPEKKP